MSASPTFAVAPSAARLTTSLRDIGYDLPSAVADLVDNSIAAGAGRVKIRFEGENSYRVLIADDGGGMSADRVHEALRFGSRRTYGRGELGRYGLGLKTASLSQARTLTVVSRAQGEKAVTVRQLSLNHVEQYDNWVIIEPRGSDAIREAMSLLDEGFSTIVIWEDLDRVIPEGMAHGWATRRLTNYAQKTGQHLSMVFHRYLDGSRGQAVDISVDGQRLEPWDPFARQERSTIQLPSQTFEISSGTLQGTVILDRWVLPSRHQFSSPAAFEAASGPLKWNRQQGIYIYRADRLVQGGGWAGLRAVDEHMKLARCALTFDTDLDAAFNINVAKMRVSLPTELRTMLQRPVQEVCNRAEAVYREANLHAERPEVTHRRSSGSLDAQAGLALLAAAASSGQLDSLRSIAKTLQKDAPELARTLGLDAF